MYITICKRGNQRKLDVCIKQGTQSRCSLTTWRDRVGRKWEGGEGFRMEGTPVYLWPIHADVWKKPSQYWKVIILQFK